MRKAGRKVPAGYLDKPDLPPWLQFYADSFWLLNNDRQIGMGIGPIPFTAIDAYARRYRIEDIDHFDRFLSLIKIQDSEYLRLTSPKGDNGVREEVSADDPDGVRRLTKRLAKKAPAPHSASENPSG